MQLTNEIVAKNLYEVLGLKNTATIEEVAKAYRALALKHHPDKNHGDVQAAKKFQEINEAYEVIGNADPQVREQYDRLSPHGQRYIPDPEGNDDNDDEDQGNLTTYAQFFAQMRFLMLINLLNIFKCSPSAARSATPMSPDSFAVQDTGRKVAEDYSLSEIHQELVQWFKETGKDDRGYSCELVIRGGQKCLLVQAPTQQGLDEVEHVLELRGLIESKGKELSRQEPEAEEPFSHSVAM